MIQALEHIGMIVILGVALLAFYLLPAALAVVMNHRQKAAIIALNVLLGWTLVGWIVAMEWTTGFSRRRRRAPVDEYNAEEPGPSIYGGSRWRPTGSRYD